MKKQLTLGLFATAMLLFLVSITSAPTFIPLDTGLVVRLPNMAIKGKNFNIGIYVSDVLAGGSTDNSAEMYASVSGPGTVEGWNSWFEVQGLFIDWGVSDLIVQPVNVDGVTYKSFKHKDIVSKLGDVPGWTGSIVCKADTIGTYTFTIGTSAGSWDFQVEVYEFNPPIRKGRGGFAPTIAPI